MVHRHAAAPASFALLAALALLAACSGGGGGSKPACAAGQYGPGCTPCACGEHGTCDEGLAGTGACACADGWAGAACDACAAGRHGPSCAPCACGEHGTCDEGLAGTGACACADGWAGAACDACAAGRYGPSCAACVCSGGTCDEGLAGTGACSCNAGLQDGDGDGVCTPTCATAALACAHGACGDASGTARCFCDPGYGGALCDTCDGSLGTVRGVVYAPQGTDPVADALVYVPGAAVEPFPDNVTCGCSVSGSPLVSARTDVNGAFTLRDVPAGTNVPLVVQVGRWRRRVTIAAVAGCGETVLSTSLTRLPRDQTEGDIPRLAVVTGDVEALECVLRKMGVSDSEFTQPRAGGRIHLYAGSGSPGATIGSSPPTEAALFSSASTLAPYDGVLLPCQGSQYSHTSAQTDALVSYANAGGRVLATHYSFTWLYRTVPFSTTATWTPDQNAPDDQPAYIDTSFPGGMGLAQWLQARGASRTLGEIPLTTLRRDFDAVSASSQVWASIARPSGPVLYSFGTPVGNAPPQQCGRVMYGEIHSIDASAMGTTFPAECNAGAMTPQERLLEYLLLDLTRCEATNCVPRTCAAAGAACGVIQDGCGGTVQCGGCRAPAMCRANACVRL